ARPNAGALRPGGHLRQLFAGGQHATLVDRSVRLRVGGGQLERGRHPEPRDRRRNRLALSLRRLRGVGRERRQFAGRSAPGVGFDQSRSRRVPAIHLDGDAGLVAENLYRHVRRRGIMARWKVLVVELNEVTWDLIDPLIEQGKLPTFARLKREGAWAAPVSVDAPPYLDPWVTWTTVYTGRAQEDHNVFFLEQPPETIRAERIWEICHRSGLRVGVYGSLCSWPPQKVNGFYVPSSFAQNTATPPASLEPIQRLNLTYTRSIRLPADHDGLWFKARLGAKLLALGLGARTAARVARQLATERAN